MLNQFSAPAVLETWNDVCKADIISDTSAYAAENVNF